MNDGIEIVFTSTIEKRTQAAVSETPSSLPCIIAGVRFLNSLSQV
jgi:hypothetical protein